MSETLEETETEEDHLHHVLDEDADHEHDEAINDEIFDEDVHHQI